MKFLDRFLQNRRIRIAGKYIQKGSFVLDVGCGDGALFRSLKDKVVGGVGIDPTLEQSLPQNPFRLIKGYFPEALTEDQCFDAITALAILEHIPTNEQRIFANACFERLKPGGLLIITVPSPQVDIILDILRALRLIDGMALEEHYGFKPAKTNEIFSSAGLRLVDSKKFQFGLNNLFVFTKPKDSH